jgi:hypothetical protein
VSATNILLVLILLAILADALVTRAWLRESRRVLAEMEKQAADILDRWKTP